MVIQFIGAKIRADYENPEFYQYEERMGKKKQTKVVAKINTNIGSEDRNSESEEDED